MQTIFNGGVGMSEKKYIDVDLLKSELRDLNESKRLCYMGVFDVINSRILYLRKLKCGGINMMTDEQTIKALEHCVKTEFISDCAKCEMFTFDCQDILIENALDIIKRQKAENEELRSDKIIAERHEKDARDLFVDCTRQLEEAKAEIERLKRGVTFTFTIEDFESIKETVISSFDNKIKLEAIKEFAEKLKKRFYLSAGRCVVDVYHIDNLVKEMEEEA